MGFHSPVYHLIPADLRLPPSEALVALLSPSPVSQPGAPILSPNLPTLLLFECVLVYMEPSASGALIQWFAEYFTDRAPLGGLVYEMFGLGDSFGRVMLNNLLVSPLVVNASCLSIADQCELGPPSLPPRRACVPYSCRFALSVHTTRLHRGPRPDAPPNQT
jgi:hypothetical protein